MVQEWLQKYVFNGDIQAAEKAETVTDYLSDFEQFMRDGRRVDGDSLSLFHPGRRGVRHGLITGRRVAVGKKEAPGR